MPDDFAYPRPEYPRPDRQRGTLEGYDWLNLNGPWQFRFDPDRRGQDQKWFEPDEPDWREQIIVPFCWESLAAWGEGDAAGNETYYSTRVFRNPLAVTRDNHRSAARYEVGWYKRAIRIPNNSVWQDKRVILTIGAADFYTEGWCNGKFLGQHEGGYTPFEFDLTDALSPPDAAGNRHALLVLRVEDPMDNHEQPVGKQWRWYTSTSGIWQTVFVEPRGATFIHHFQITTDIEKKIAHFNVQCAGPRATGLTLEISAPDGARHRAEFSATNNHLVGDVPIEKPLLWNPNEPHLYRVVMRLQQDAATTDVVRTYFGMRKLDALPSKEGPGVLRLNGVARYLRGALYQSYFPDGVYTAGNVQTLKDDIAWARKFGFNFLRVHIKIDDPLLLYYADKLGMLLMCDFPNFGEGGDTELGRRRFETMMREAIERDFNHPSIFAWCIFNETWGFGGQAELLEILAQPRAKRSKQTDKQIREARTKLANLGSHAWVRKMWELAKRLDPTRLIEDMSVVHWEHLDYYGHGETDINSWHFYLHDYEEAREHINKIVTSTYVGSGFNYVPGFQHSGEPLINSEYGGVSCSDGDRDVSWSFKFLTNELRRHEEISAYIYTELHDVEWEYNGFLNYDRTPKEFGYDPTIINESNTLPMDTPPIRRVKPGETFQIEVASSHFGSKAEQDVTLEWRLGGVDTVGHYHRDLARGWTRIPFPHRRVAPAHTLELTAPALPMVCELKLSAYNGVGNAVACNFTHLLVADQYPPAREKSDGAVILRSPPHQWAGCDWSSGTESREQQQVEDVSFGMGHGFFEWHFALPQVELREARSLRILFEASSHRIDHPQTDGDVYPTTLHVLLNSVCVHQSVLRNQPHDARGVLSYLRKRFGDYGYLIHAYVEDDLLREVIAHAEGDVAKLRCVVPPDAIAQGGLTVYGAETGRYPICPTLIVEKKIPRNA